MKNPIVGGGAGAFRQWLVDTSDPLSQAFHYHTHNEYLTQLSQFGFLGLLLFLGIFFFSSKAVRGHSNPLIENCVSVVFVIFLLNSLSDSSLHNEWEGWTLVLFSSIAIANKLRFNSDD